MTMTINGLKKWTRFDICDVAEAIVKFCGLSPADQWQIYHVITGEPMYPQFGGAPVTFTIELILWRVPRRRAMFVVLVEYYSLRPTMDPWSAEHWLETYDPRRKAQGTEARERYGFGNVIAVITPASRVFTPGEIIHVDMVSPRLVDPTSPSGRWYTYKVEKVVRRYPAWKQIDLRQHMLIAIKQPYTKHPPCCSPATS